MTKTSDLPDLSDPSPAGSPPAGSSPAEPPPGHRVVVLASEPVELYKILKFEGLAASGGEAKAAIATGQVSVNRRPESQKRKKICAGDTITYKGEKLFMTLAPKTAQQEQQAPPVKTS